MLLFKHTSKIFVCLSLLLSFGFSGLTTVFLLPEESFSATFNVTNSTKLRNALQTAQSNRQADTINIVAGTFSTGGSTFTYNAESGENFALTIVGAAGIRRTILDGGNNTRVLQITTALFSSMDSQRNITIRGLTVQSGFEDFGSGGGLFVLTFSAGVTIENCRFSSNSAEFEGGGVRISTSNGHISLTNNEFADNSARDGGGASPFSPFGRITLTNNTFTNNSAVVAGGGAEVSASAGAITLTNNTFTLNSGGFRAILFANNVTINIYNNIIFNNTAQNGDDISVIDDFDNSNAGSAVNLFNNDFSDFFSECDNTSGCTPNISEGGNINQNPLFVDAPNGNVHLQGGSPAINAGNLFAPALPATDFDVEARILDTAPDIGADEILTCGGQVPTILGTPGDDVNLNGTSGPNVIVGLGGNDIISGFGGVDRICGGDGMDTINGGSGGDFLFGDRNNDTLNGDDNNDQLFGGAGDDTMNGGNDTDICEQNGAADTFTLCETIIIFSAGLSGVWVGDLIQNCEGRGEDLICTIEGTLEVENPGIDPAPNSTLRFFLSLDESLDENDTLLQETEAGPLEPKEIKEVNLFSELPTGQDATDQFVIAVLDADDVVSEANEENNIVVSPAVEGEAGGGSNAGCAIVAEPVRIGTSTFNILIILIPLLWIGLRWMTRRKSVRKVIFMR